MVSIDPIFVFKQHFNRDDADAIIASTIHHRGVWNRLKDDGFLQDIIAGFSLNKEYWTAAHICLLASGFDSQSLTDPLEICTGLIETAKANKEKNKIEPNGHKYWPGAGIPIEQVPLEAATLILEQQSYGNWGSYLASREGVSFSPTDISNGIGTLFSLIYFLTEDRKDLLLSLGQSDLSGTQDLTAFLLSANPALLRKDFIDIHDWMTEIPAGNIIRIIESMSAFDDRETMRSLADHYLASNPIDTVLGNNSAEKSASDTLLAKIAHYKNYAVLSRYGSNQALSEEFSSYASELGNQLNRSLSVLKAQLFTKNEIHQSISPSDLSQRYAAVEKSIAVDHPVRKIMHAAEVVESDRETAWKIAKSVYKEIREIDNIQQLLPKNDMGFLIRSEQIVQLFLDMDLIPEASEIAEKLIDLQPRNNELLRLSAKIFHQYGDYQKAIEYYIRLDLSGVLTREEKVSLAESFEIKEDWPSALEVWEKTNLVSLEDYQRKVICAYRAGNRNSFEETVKAAGNFYTTEGLFKILRILFDLKDGLLDIAQVEIDTILDNKKRDRWIIQFLIEYYLETSQAEKAMTWIDGLCSLEKEIPEVCLERYEVSRQLADMDTCKAILTYNAQHDNHQSLAVIEHFVQWCFDLNDLENAQKLMRRFAEKWPLSPNLTSYKAHLLNEQGQYKSAQESLRVLLKRNDVEESWLITYGLAKSENGFAAFPLKDSILTEDAQQSLTDEEEVLFNQFTDSLMLKVIGAELDKGGCLERYQAILADKHFHQNADIWRVHAGMGKFYYQNKKYDLALVSFKEARKFQPQNKIISLYLINCFAKMKLFEDAVDVFSSSKLDHQLDIFDFLEINASLKNSEQWLVVLKTMVEEQPQAAIAQIVIAQLYAENGNAEQVLKIIQSIDFSGDEQAVKRLIATQILVNAGFEKAGKKMLEYFLTANELINEDEYLAGAFLYIQLKEFHKAANLLNLIKKKDYAVLALKSELFNKLGLVKEAQASIQSAIQLYEHLEKSEQVGVIGWIQEPEIWKVVYEDPVWLYLKSIESNIANKRFTTALDEAQHCIRQFPNDLRLASLTLNIINVFGDGVYPGDLLEQLPEQLEDTQVSDNICVFGEIALRSGHEILAANLVSQCIALMPDSMRVKALQARLLARNGNQQDAQELFKEILGKSAKLANTESYILDQYQFWLAEAAFDLGEYVEVLAICKMIFSKAGITNAASKLFLASLLKIAYENWVNQKLNVTSHLEEISEDDLKCFDEICVMAEKGIKEDVEIQRLIMQVEVWLTYQSDERKPTVQIDPAGLSGKELIVSEYHRKGSGVIEVELGDSGMNTQDKFILSLLEMDANPQKAFEFLSDVMRNSASQPRHYAALAYIKNNLGQFEDAYAAINLALAEWENEYKWQILAGELSKKAGDLHGSLSHFKQAAEIHQDEDTQTYLGELNLQAGNRMGISYLESKLKGDDKDLETLVELGDLSIKNNNFQKAAKYLEKARKADPQDVRAYVLLSQVALNVGNLEKAQEMIDQAYQIDTGNAEVITQKANILEKKNGTKQALDFLTQVDHEQSGKFTDIVLKKADYLAVEEGRKSAINYLKSVGKDQSEAAIIIKIAKFYLEDGELNTAEETAEQALRLESNNPQVMKLLANIFTQTGDLDKAIDFFVKAIQIDPFATDFYIELAKIYQSRRELNQAADVLQSGLQSNPMNFDLLCAVGLLYYQQGMYNKSQDYLQQAAKIDPKNENVKRLLSTLMNANIIHAGKRKSSSSMRYN